MRRIQRQMLGLLLFTFLLRCTVFSQLYERKIVEYVRKISEGKSEEVLSKLPDLKTKFPHAAGMIYIEGLVATNGEESIKCFNVIADSFPRSEWADDALARLFEYHMQVGEPREAETNLHRLQHDFPASPYITTGYLQQERLSADSLTSKSIPQKNEGQIWAIQIGAFAVKKNAENLKNKIAADGYLVNVYENLLDGKNVLYLVWVGMLATPEEAKPLLKEIKSRYNIDGVLRVRQSWKKW
jgi:SPOR domain